MDHPTDSPLQVCTCGHARDSHRYGSTRCIVDCGCLAFEPRPNPERFTLGTYAAYPDVNVDGPLYAAIRDEETGKVYPFRQWDAARGAIARMRAADSPLFFFAAVGTIDGFTPAEPGVDEGAGR